MGFVCFMVVKIIYQHVIDLCWWVAFARKKKENTRACVSVCLVIFPCNDDADDIVFLFEALFTHLSSVRNSKKRELGMSTLSGITWEGSQLTE